MLNYVVPGALPLCCVKEAFYWASKKRIGRWSPWHLAWPLPSFAHPDVRARVAMSDEPILREKACNAVLSGKLSGRSPDRTWGGPGVGAICSVCELPVTKEEKEFEIQFAHRIIDYNGEMVEESYTGFPTIAAAVADGNERLRRHAEREAPVRPRRAR